MYFLRLFFTKSIFPFIFEHFYLGVHVNFAYLVPRATIYGLFPVDCDPPCFLQKHAGSSVRKLLRAYGRSQPSISGQNSELHSSKDQAFLRKGRAELKEGPLLRVHGLLSDIYAMVKQF